MEQLHPRVWCAGDAYGPNGLLAAVASAERVAAQLADAPWQAFA